MTPSQTSALMAQLMRLYPREEVDAERLRAYCALLADLDHERAKAAVARVVAKCKFFPTIAEIREEYAQGELDAEPAELAWARVLRQVQLVGRYNEPTFANPYIADAVAAIGWEAICASRLDDNSIRAQFREAYRSSLRRSVHDVQVPAFARSAAQRKRLGEPKQVAAALPPNHPSESESK